MISGREGSAMVNTKAKVERKWMGNVCLRFQSMVCREEEDGGGQAVGGRGWRSSSMKAEQERGRGKGARAERWWVGGRRRRALTTPREVLRPESAVAPSREPWEPLPATRPASRSYTSSP